MADRYWVGGTANWDGTAGTKWATTSGGAGGASVPTSADDVFFTNLSTGTVTIAAGNTGAKSINCTGFAGTISGTASITVAGSVILSSGMTYNRTGVTAITGTGTITSAGKTFGNITMDGVGITVTLGDSVISSGFVGLTSGTLNLNNWTLTADSFASSNSNVRTIAFGTGKIVITGTAGWTTLTTTNLTISGTPVVDVTNSGSVSVSVSPGNPTVANTVSFNFTAGTYALGVSGNVRSLNFTGFSGTLSNAARSVAGSIVFSSGMTVSAGTSATTFNATSGGNTITTNGKTLDFPITFNGVGGAWQLQDALTLGSTRTMTLTNGSFDAATYSVTLGLFSSTNSNTRTISMGSGLWTLAGTGTVWTTATATNLTFNKGTADILLSSGSATARSFAGGGLTFNKITIGGATGSSTTNIQAINATELASTKPVAHTITITSATALSFDTWSVSGTAGNVVTLNSSVAGTRRTFNLTNVTSGIDYLAVQDMECLQTNRFYVGANSTDNGNNVNVYFTASPSVAVKTIFRSVFRPVFREIFRPIF